VGPLVAINDLKPIQTKVLQSLCNADGSAEFWIRRTYLLTLSGTLLLMLTFGEFHEDTSIVDTLRRSLWLVLVGVFVSVCIISRQVRRQIRTMLARQPPAPVTPLHRADAEWPNAQGHQS